MPTSSTPILTYILTADGLEPTPYRATSLVDAVAHEPPGVYTVARTFEGSKAQLLDAHLDRLEESARLVHIPLTLDRARLRAALRELLQRSGYVDAKFRITVPQDAPDQLYLALELFQPVPEHIVREGARVLLVPLVRENPVAKTTAWMSVRRPTQAQLPPEFYEGVLVDADGYLLEGLSSNFYAVLDGTLRTAGMGMLEGITRRAILTIAPAVLPVDLRAVHQDDVARIDEALLTSSGRGVVPITGINVGESAVTLGDGTPGPVTRDLMQRYLTWTQSTLEPI